MVIKNINKTQSEYKLFIDELGIASVKNTQSEVYILAGCSVNEADRHDIKIWADHIKFKYWGRTDIVLHSREIWRKENDFSVLKSKKIFTDFLEDMERFLLCSKFKMFFVLVDKQKARKAGWNDKKIYQETSHFIVRNFLLTLFSSDSVGKIVIESSTAEKDFYFHRALGFFLSEGMVDMSVDYKKIQETITSISFVTKKNHDIEEQIADFFAYAAKCKYLKKQGKEYKEGTYEEMILKLLEKKLFKTPHEAGVGKMKFFKELNSFMILPS